LPEPARRRLIQQHLADRGEAHRLQRAGGALGGGIEAAERFQRVSEKIEPHRLLRARRKDVDHPAAHGEIARLAHGRGLGIAIDRQKPGQGLGVDVLTHDGIEARLRHRRNGRAALDQRGGGGRHQHWRAAGPAPGKRGERRKAGRRHVWRGAHPIVGQAVPRRQAQRGEAGGEEFQRSEKLA
jgi:hypothetical protein